MSEFKQRPFSIRMFLPDGDPDGLRVVEKSNWTGVGLVFKRAGYREAAKREEFARTGVYVLVGAVEASSQPMIYVGEGDPIRPRLDQHYARRDFWDWGMFFVSKDTSLNKAHVQYLECRLLELAREAKQARLDNIQRTTPPTLVEAEQADMDSFLADMLSIFPLVGLSVFEKPETPAQARNTLQLGARGVDAQGYEDTKGFVVRSGSKAAADEVASIHNYMRTIRQDLIDQGVMAQRDGHLVLKQASSR